MGLPPGVYERPNTRSLWVRYRDRKGRVVRESASTTDPEQARKYREEKIAKNSGPEGLFLAVVVRAWFETHPIKESSKKTYADSLKAWAPFLEGLTVEEVNKALIKEFVHARRAQEKPPKDVTINRDIAWLSSVMTFATSLPEGPETLPAGIFTKLGLKAPSSRRRLLSTEEEASLLEACTTDTHRAIIILALETGMRQAEIMNLRWDQHVDLDRREVSLDAEDTKTSEPRVIPLSDRALATLKAQKRHARRPYVFWHGDGLLYLTFRNWWYAVIRRSGVKNFRFHDLRHAFCSRRIQAGWPEAAVQQIMGHKTRSMTNRYTHLATGDLHRLMAALPG